MLLGWTFSDLLAFDQFRGFLNPSLLSYKDSLLSKGIYVGIQRPMHETFLVEIIGRFDAGNE